MNRGLPTIYVSARSMKKLYPLLEKHIIPSMLYKLKNPKI